MFNDETAETNPITDTGRVAAAVAAKVREKLAQDVEAAVKKALQERDSKYKKMLQKALASVLGIVKDPEL